MATWNGNHGSHGQRGPASPHQCRRQQVELCQCCKMPTNARFLANGLCPACRLAMVKMELDEMTEAEIAEPTMTDADLDDLWAAVRDHLS